MAHISVSAGSQQSEQTSDTVTPGPVSGWSRYTLIIFVFLVFVIMGIFPIYATLRANQASERLRLTINDQVLMGVVHTMIIQENLDFQRYQLEPSATNKQRFMDTANVVSSALFDAQNTASQRADVDARRLAGEQSEYRRSVDPFMRDVSHINGTVEDRLATYVAFQDLVQDIDGVCRKYSTDSAKGVRAVNNNHMFLVISTIVTLVIGAGLIGMIFYIRRERPRAVLGDDSQGLPPGIDPLTGLPDETGFVSRVKEALDEARESGGGGVAILSIKLVDFDNVGVVHGKDGCDQLLVAASRRLSRAIRDVDIVARWGEDGFTVLLRDITNRPDVQIVTDRIKNILNRDFRLQGGITSVSARVGVAIGPPDDDPEAIIRRAIREMQEIDREHMVG